MNVDSMASGWYYSKRGGPDGQPTGPLTWEQLHTLAQAAELTPYDLVWHPTFPGWLPAAQVPGLIPAATSPAVQAPYRAPEHAGAAYGRTTEPTAAQSTGRSRSWLYWAVPLVVLVLVGAGLGVYFGVLRGGEGDGSTVSSNTTTVVSETASTTAPTTTTTIAMTSSTTASTTTTSASTTTTTVGVSSESIAYAKSLGGTSHQGETLYFVIGTSVESEQEAQQALNGAAFGDVQMYFIVQKSDNFEGMEPGWWVVFEARRTEPEASEMDWYRRGFPDAYVKSATVRTSDPIPVYEDLVSEGD